MAERDPLVDLYLQRHPREAVAVLETLEPEAVLGLLDELADDRVSDILGQLAPATAAACVALMDVERAAARLGNLPRRSAVAVMRLLPADRTAGLLRAMPAAGRLQLEVLLRQPSHRVSGWLDSRVVTVEPGSTVEALRARLGRNGLAVGEVYLVDGEGRLQGCLPLFRLVAARGDQLVESLALPPRHTLRSFAGLDEALEDPGWEDGDVLPVVDREGRLVGCIRHAVLWRACHQRQPVENSTSSGEYISLANSLYVGLAEVLATSIAKTKAADAPVPDQPAPQAKETSS